jgi:hypothetical protein
MEDMVKVAEAAPLLRADSRRRYEQSLGKFKTPEAFDKQTALDRLDQLMGELMDGRSEST